MMKKILVIEISNNKLVSILPEEGQTEKDFKGNEKKKELQLFREGFTEEVQEAIAKRIEEYIKSTEGNSGLLNDFFELEEEM